MLHWYAVHAKPRQEALAEENLRRQGFTTYLPMLRRRRLQRGAWRQASEPLFPRYLFIQADTTEQSLAPVRSTLGVSSLVRFGQRLRPVPDEVIAYLQAAEDRNAGVRVDDEWPFSPGDAVEVVSGPLAGLRGIYQNPVAEARAMVLLELLGRSTSVALDFDTVGARST